MKRIIIVLAAALIVFITVGIIFIKYKSNEIDLKSLSGDILITNPNSSDTGSGKGLKVYHLNSGNSTEILNQMYFRNPSYNYSKDKVLGITVDIVDRSLGITRDSIAEYDLKSNDLKTIVSFNDYTSCSYVKYVPNDENLISFTRENKLYLYDKTMNKEHFIYEGVGYYSWNNDGKYFLFSKDGNICTYDMVTNKIDELFPGGQPEYSKDNKYMAYIASPSIVGNILVVREMATDKEWKYKSNGIYYYKFSPDDEHIAIIQENTTIKWFYGQEIKLWNFKSNKTAMLEEHIESGYYSSFDGNKYTIILNKKRA
jgi:hypothetical protein